MCIIVVYGEISLGFVHFELNLDRNKMEKNINIFCFVVKKKAFCFQNGTDRSDGQYAYTRMDMINRNKMTGIGSARWWLDPCWVRSGGELLYKK